MTDRDVNVRVTARDEASDDFQRVGQNARRMGQEIDRASDQAQKGFRGVGDAAKRFGDNLDEIGTAVGVVTGAFALLGRNALERERDIDALGRAYGDSADEIIAFTEAIQDSTNFSNDAAREAALTASTLTRAYGLTADEAQRVVEISADLAQVYGIGLADATTRVAAAIRGEGEAAEALGLNLSDAAVAAAAASRGFDTYATTATEAEKATFRYNLLLEQTARFHGAAGEAAEGAAGRGADFRDWLDDTAESAGRAIGPMGEFLAISGDLALAAPLAGNAIGRLAQGMGSLTFLANPLALAIGGTAAAAGLAALAYRDMREEQDRLNLSTEEVEDSVDTLIGTLVRLQEGGASQGTLENVRALSQTIIEIGQASNAIPQAAVDAANAAALLNNEAATGATVVDEYGAVVVGASNAAIGLMEALDGAKVSGELFSQAMSAAATILGDESRPNYAQLVAEVERLTDELKSGAISPETYLEAIVALGAQVETFGLTLDTLAPKIDTTTAAIGDVVTGLIGMGNGMADIGPIAEDTGAAVDDLTFSMGEAESGAVALGEASGTAGEAIGGMATPARTVAGVVGDLAGAWDDLGATLDENAELQRAVNEGIAEAARLTADADATRAAGLAAGQAELDQQRARSRARAEEAEAAAEQEDAVLAAAAAYREEAVSLDEAALAMGSVGYASFAAIDGVVSLTEQQRLLAVQSSELAGQQNAVASELGFYRGAVDDMTAAYDLLIARQQAGEQLNQDQLDFIAEFESESAGHQRAIEDLVIQQGLLADAQLDNAEASQGLTDTMGELVEPMTIIAAALAEMAGLDLDNLDPGEQAVSNWERLAGAVGAARGTVAGDASGGPGGNAAAPAAPRDAGAQSIAVTLDTTAVRLGAAEIAGYLAAVTEADWTVQVVGDGDDAFAVIRDVEGDVQAVVKGDYVVEIDGDALGATAEIDAVWAALDAIDGASATVAAYADTRAARDSLNGLTGYQGDAYVNVYAVPANNLPGYTPPYAGGGVVAAASGRVVRAGEIGPELVYPPGGAPYLAARDGLYVMETGSYVRNAAATRPALQPGGRRVSFAGATFNFYGVSDGRRAARDFMAEMQAIGR